MKFLFLLLLFCQTKPSVSAIAQDILDHWTTADGMEAVKTRRATRTVAWLCAAPLPRATAGPTVYPVQTLGLSTVGTAIAVINVRDGARASRSAVPHRRNIALASVL